ncbi:hypothetical protein SedNR2807_07860 [Citrobacter sedlakii]
MSLCTKNIYLIFFSGLKKDVQCHSLSLAKRYAETSKAVIIGYMRSINIHDGTAWDPGANDMFAQANA